MDFLRERDVAAGIGENYTPAETAPPTYCPVKLASCRRTLGEASMDGERRTADTPGKASNRSVSAGRDA